MATTWDLEIQTGHLGKLVHQEQWVRGKGFPYELWNLCTWRFLILARYYMTELMLVIILLNVWVTRDHQNNQHFINCLDFRGNKL